ncbi:MAG: hypothetical protein JW822_09395 [Spirochaetales bacterium]|nr:hypothetical protein [Spirochaetales bacterium]
MKKNFMLAALCVCALGLPWADSAVYTYKTGEYGIFIIGWSKGGKLAYGRSTGDCGNYGPCRQFSVTLMDMVDDKQVWGHSTGPEGNIAGSTYENFAQFWNGEYATIAAALSGNKIQSACSGCMIMDTNSLQEQYGITVEVMTDEDPETPGFSKTSIIVYDGAGRKKTVSADSGFSPTKQTVLGFVKSPFEKRIALLVRTDYSGPEMGSSSYAFIGCHLAYGFN